MGEGGVEGEKKGRPLHQMNSFSLDGRRWGWGWKSFKKFPLTLTLSHAGAKEIKEGPGPPPIK